MKLLVELLRCLSRQQPRHAETGPLVAGFFVVVLCLPSTGVDLQTLVALALALVQLQPDPLQLAHWMHEVIHLQCQAKAIPNWVAPGLATSMVFGNCTGNRCLNLWWQLLLSRGTSTSRVWGLIPPSWSCTFYAAGPR